MIYVILFMGLLFLGIGRLLTVGNAGQLLAGYNTMSEEERRGFDLEGYIPFFRRFHWFLGLSFLAGGFGLYYLVDVDVAGIFLGVYPILAYIYFLWASRRFYRTAGEAGSAGSSGAIKSSIVGIWVLVGSLVFVLGIMALGYQEDRLTVQTVSGNPASSEIQEFSIHIGGMYGETIPLSEIQGFALIDTLPKITFRENGFAMGRIRKGYFRTADKERVKLILNTKTPPYILITKTNGRKIYYTPRSAPAETSFMEIKDLLKNKL